MFVIRHVMVADDKVYTALARILHFVGRLDAAVQSYDQRASLLLGIIHSTERYAVSLGVTVGNIIVDVRIEGAQEPIHQCHSRSAVHIIITVYQYLLAVIHGLRQTLLCLSHAHHQHGVMQLFKRRVHKRGCLLTRRDTTTYQQRRRYRTDVQLLRQSVA